tara:strand:+ start:1826 stop:2032 length:207 start_codon:yes stop_codon:yes gene_type:complete
VALVASPAATLVWAQVLSATARPAPLAEEPVWLAVMRAWVPALSDTVGPAAPLAAALARVAVAARVSR